MTESLFNKYFWLCLSEMLLATFAGPSCSSSPFIRVPLKLLKFADYYPYNYYVGAVSLGTPPQPFNVFIDPGTAELAIRSPLNNINSIQGRPVYDSKKSSTYQKNFTQSYVSNAYDTYFVSVYSPGALRFGQGFLSTDTLKIGKAKIKNQTFIEMTELGPQMYSQLSEFTDGILGLAYPEATPSGATPFFQNMIQQGIITNPTFALTYSKIRTEFELTLGGIDSTKFRGLPTWTPITEKRFWKFSASGLVIRYSECNITRLSCNGTMGCQMVINMNRDGIYGPFEVLSRLGSLLGSTEFTQYQGIDCKYFSTNTLPDIGFTIGGNDFFMTPANYMRTEGFQYCRPNSTKYDFAWSYFNGVTPIDIINGNSEVWLLGTPFLQAVSTVFDFGNNRIGFTPN